MVRVYKPQGKKKRWTMEQKRSLLARYKAGTSSVKTFCRENDIPYQTFRDWLQDEQRTAGSGTTTALSPAIERLLVTLVVMLSASGVPMGRNMLPKLVEKGINEGALQVNPKVKFTANRPGPDWVKRFYKRHKKDLTLRKKDKLTYKRAQSLTKANKALYFEMLDKVIKDHDIQPRNIYNADEAGFQADSGEQTVWYARALKNAYGVISQNARALYSVLFCCNALGDYLPTLTIFRAAGLWYPWTTNGDEDAFYTTTKNGWMEERVFTNWFTKVFIPLTKPDDPNEARLFIFDGHPSHISFEMASAAVAHNIHLLCLPPHCTHALQPLDVACFRSAKAVWADVCQKWFDKNPNKVLGKEDFPHCLKIVSDHLKNNPGFVVNGFRACGIVPFDSTAGDDKVGTTNLMTIAYYLNKF